MTSYESVRSPLGYRVRTVVTRPHAAAAGRLPAILFIPWLSCDPVERAEPGNDGCAPVARRGAWFGDADAARGEAATATADRPALRAAWITSSQPIRRRSPRCARAAAWTRTAS